MNTMSALAVQNEIALEPENEDSKINKTFTFDRTFQEKIVQACLIDRVWASQFSEVLDVNYFQPPYLKLIAFEYFQYHSKYKEFPSFDLLLNILKDKLKSEKDQLLREQIKSFLVKVKDNENLGDLGYVKEKSLEFCKKVGLQKALEQSVDLMKTEKYEKIVELIKNAISAGDSNTAGLDLFADIDTRYSETFRRTVPTGIMELDQRKILNGGLGAGELGVIVAPTGCHARGAEILMFDGTIKKVEEVKVGDCLMGPDSKPRKVLRLIRGQDDLYEIKTKWGYSAIFNKAHTLALQSSKTKQHIEITIEEYLKSSKYFKGTHFWQQPENGINFKSIKTELDIPPYILGILLGDGSLKRERIELTTADEEIKEEWKKFIDSHGYQISEHRKKENKAAGWYYKTNAPLGKKINLANDFDKIRRALRKYNLLDTKSENKFVPHQYKIASQDERMQLLAGLIDTDGYLDTRGRNYEIITKSEQLAKDIAFIARSVGLSAFETKKYNKTYNRLYNRINIGGPIEKIPVRVPRKKLTSTKKPKKRHWVCNFKITQKEPGDYYGFTVDRDNLYLSSDLGIIRNCGKSHFLVHLGAAALKQGKNVLYYSYELNERAIGIRFDSHLLGINSTDCYDSREEIKKYYEENQENLGRLKIKYYPTGTATINTIRSHVEKLGIQEKFRPDLILIDYAGIMRSTEKYELLRLELKKIYEELRSLANELDVPIWTASQSNKEGADKEVVDLTNMAEAYGQAHVADFIVGLARKSLDKATGYGTIFIAKNRAGMDGIKYFTHLDTGKSTLKVVNEDEIRNISSSDEDVENSMKYLRRRFKEMQHKSER